MNAWVSLSDRSPAEGQRVKVWVEELNQAPFEADFVATYRKVSRWAKAIDLPFLGEIFGDMRRKDGDFFDEEGRLVANNVTKWRPVEKESV